MAMLIFIDVSGRRVSEHSGYRVTLKFGQLKWCCYTADMAGAGLRERKKQQTRLRIRQAAMELFAARGFDAVPVAEIAEAAEVSEATIFNYFPTKEDLVYGGMEAFEESLVAAVRARPAGTTTVEAFRAAVLQRRGALADPDPAGIAQLAVVARVIAASPALQAREHRIVDRTTQALAEIVARERRARAGDVRPWVIANALMGVNRAMTRTIQADAIAGRSPAAIARHALAEGRRGFRVLQHGLGDGGEPAHR
jgi:AcrR family transcriptional regulator